MKIFAFHLLNDYSGSPKVLSQLLHGWVENGHQVTVITGHGREGFLSAIAGVNYYYYNYHFAENKLIRLCNLMASQLSALLKFSGKIKKGDIVYVNTVLPFGAALIGKLKGCRVIYHIHETTVNPPIFKRFLFGLARWAADDAIFVSHFLRAQEPFPRAKEHVIYNAIEDAFYRQASLQRTISETPNCVLMVCSLKAYKGINEFVQLAKLNGDYRFRLVLNATQAEIDDFFTAQKTAENVEIFPTQTNLHPHYRWADVILNLSRPDGWIETFGLTIIEGMAYGLPAIIPPVGGITEVVVEGINGYQVDSRDIDLLSERLNHLFRNQSVYREMSRQSLERLDEFREIKFFERHFALLH